MKNLRWTLGVLILALAGCNGVLGDLLTSVREVQLPPQVFMEFADQETLTPEIIPSDATNKQVRWVSDNPAVVQVNDQGQLIPLGEGVATVQVITEDGQKTARTQVTVTDKTWVTGTVYAPNGVDPIPHALVWVPLGPVPALAAGVTQFSKANYPGSNARTFTYTDATGKFTLRRMPAGKNIPLVFQLGKWRRQVTLPSVAYRESTPIASNLLKLPGTQAEGDLPRVAVVTGAVDNPENHLRRFGIADAEFTNPSGPGMIHFYKNRVGPGAVINPQTPVDTALWSSQSQANSYDLMFIACNGQAAGVTSQEKTVFNNYLSAGGRVYTGHFGSIWLKQNPVFAPAVSWSQTTNPANQLGKILQTSSRGQFLFQWINAVTTPQAQGSIPLSNIRHDFTPLPGGGAELLVQLTNPSTVFGAFSYGPSLPTNPQVSGGRVTFVDFDNGISNTGRTFPAECSAPGSVISLQDRLYMGLILQLMDPFGP